MKIYRYEVPVDDQWHPLSLAGIVRHVATRRPDVVEVWANHCGEEYERVDKEFRVYGTGQEWPENCRYVGTALAPGGQLVWHLMERRTN